MSPRAKIPAVSLQLELQAFSGTGQRHGHCKHGQNITQQLLILGPILVKGYVRISLKNRARREDSKYRYRKVG